jgi:HK97 family phage prohead protease
MTVSTLERRACTAGRLAVRSAGESLTLSGYASLTGVPYEVAGYIETIARGAFRQTLADGADVQLLVNHTGLPLGRTRSGTLRLAEDDRGLRVEADLDAGDPDVQRLVRKLDRGDLDQMSFTFRATEQTWSADRTERLIRSVDIARGDVSVVNQGASPTTSVSVREMQRVAAERAARPDRLTIAKQQLFSLQHQAGGRGR